MINCKGQKFGHDYRDKICSRCDGEQPHFTDTKKMEKKKTFFERLAERKSQKHQWTRHQQDAVDTAKMFDDMRSLGIYLRLFKRYHRERLIECREWVDKKGTGNKGRLFVSVHKKFI